MKPFFGMAVLAAMLTAVNFGVAQNPGQPAKADPAQKDGQPPKEAKGKSGLTLNDPRAFQGYTLYSPIGSNKSFLIDMEGRNVHTWQTEGSPALTAYLLPDGRLFRPTNAGAKGKGIAGAGKRLQEIAWDGSVIWEYVFETDKEVPHHDAIKLPNGNVLAIVSMQKSAEQASAAGLKSGGSMLADSLFEIKPRGKSGGDIVWQWNAWDHVIQDADPAKPNHGKLVDHPGRIDVNFSGNFFVAIGKYKDKDKGEPGKGKDDPGKGDKGDKGGKAADWNHFNGLSYHPEFDQILVSVHNFSEFWIIDHSTTTAEAAGTKGGKYGKGGDLLYRWGNPRTYGAGDAKDQQLYFQHHAHWIPAGLAGAGNVLVFNNGPNRPGGASSSVDEIVLPLSDKGVYTHKPGTAYGPAKPFWSYTAENKSDFYATNLSGAQRLPNGNTLICSGNSSTIFEVTPKNEVVWQYIVAGQGGGPGGKGPGDGDFKKGDPKEIDSKGVDQKKDGGPPAGKGGPGGLFRAVRYPLDYPAFAGKTLTPIAPLEEPKQKDSKGK